MARSDLLPSEVHWKRIAALLRQAPQGWPLVDREPSCSGRDSADIPERRPLAGPAGDASTSLDVLTAVGGIGGAGRLAEHPAHVSERVERAPAVEFHSHEKGAQESGKSSGAG
jgi:hypothetical protein